MSKQVLNYRICAGINEDGLDSYILLLPDKKINTIDLLNDMEIECKLREEKFDKQKELNKVINKLSQNRKYKLTSLIGYPMFEMRLAISKSFKIISQLTESQLDNFYSMNNQYEKALYLIDNISEIFGNKKNSMDKILKFQKLYLFKLKNNI